MTEEVKTAQVGQGPIDDEPIPAEQPRFITAAIRFEEYLSTLDLPGDSTSRALQFRQILRSTDSIRGIAQTFEFMGSMPDLADSDARRSVAQELAVELQNPEIPEAVRGIYTELYSADLAVYVPPTESRGQ